MIDTRRLAGAVHLDGQRVGDGVYLVSGGASMHRVDLMDAEACDCADRRSLQGQVWVCDPCSARAAVPVVVPQGSATDPPEAA